MQEISKLMFEAVCLDKATTPEKDIFKMSVYVGDAYTGLAAECDITQLRLSRILRLTVSKSGTVMYH
jgi:hypothetical protein